MRLKDKVVIVTGSAEGIGKAVARRMADEGAMVVIADIQEEKGNAVAKEIKADRGEAIFVRCDVGSSNDVKVMVEKTFQTFGKIDILNNNAAIDFQAPLTETDEDSWLRVININLSGYYRGCKYVVPYMKEAGGGCIINMASTQAFKGFPGYSAYAAAKGGIISLTRQLAVELAPFHIRVNSVSPGAIHTPMTQYDLDHAEDPDKLLSELEHLHALNRLGKPEEVANAIVFLASSESSFITGEDIKVDGGLVVKPCMDL